MNEYIIIGVMVFLGAVFVGAGLLTSRVLFPRSKNIGKKLETYECGEETIGSSRIQFKIGYYLFALLFMIFDVEALFLFPAMVIWRNSESGIPMWVLYTEVLIFVVILAAGLVYAWRKKILEWE